MALARQRFGPVWSMQIPDFWQKPIDYPKPVVLGVEKQRMHSSPLLRNGQGPRTEKRASV